MTQKKGDIWISAILYILIAAVAMVLILQAGIPLLDRMKDRTTFEKSNRVLSSLDQQINEVANEGEGSQRVVPLEVREGDVVIDEDKNAIIWEIETKSQIIEPRTSMQIGNLKVYSNIDVNTIETEDTYNLSNSRIKVVANKHLLGDGLDINEVIKEIYFIGENLNEIKVPGKFTFKLCAEADSEIGTGYTELIPTGNNTNIGSAKLIIHMTKSDTDSDCGRNYDIEIVLDSQADFIKTRVLNLDTR